LKQELPVLDMPPDINRGQINRKSKMKDHQKKQASQNKPFDG
jgi:hypothetical protein